MNDSIYKSNCYEKCEFYYYFDSENKYHCTPNLECPKETNKLIRDKRKCIENCAIDDTYKYEHFYECYRECPEGTKISDENNYLCKLQCPGELPYENILTNECVESCSSKDLIDNNCIKNNLTALAINSKASQDSAVSNLQNDIVNGNMNDTLKSLVSGDKKDVIIEQEGTSIQLTTTENQNSGENKNRSTIKLGDCEDKLKKNYGIDKDKSLIMLKIDVFEEGLLIPKIEYEVYNPITFQKLNLSVCADSKVDLAIPVSIDENDLCKHDSNCDFYNDICVTYTSAKGTDVSLDKRKKEFVENNMTLCEENCDFKTYDTENKKTLCSCQIKIELPLVSAIYFNKDELYSNFVNIKNVLNFNIMKCYKVLFTKKGIKKNIGAYIIIPIIFIHFISIVLFYTKGYSILKKKIDKIIDIKMNKSKDNNYNEYKQTNLNETKDKNEENKKEDKKRNEKNNEKVKDKKNNSKDNNNDIIENKKNKEKESKKDKQNKDKKNEDKKEEEKYKENKGKINDNNIKNKIHNKSKINKEEKDNKDLNKKDKNININNSNNIGASRGKSRKSRMSTNFLGKKDIIDINKKNHPGPPIYSRKSVNSRKINITKYFNNLITNSSNSIGRFSVSKINSKRKSMINPEDIKRSKNRKSMIISNQKNQKNTKKEKNEYIYLTDYELNTLIYEDALKIDKRTYFQFYLSLIKMKHIIMFTFINYNDYNSLIIKISFFFFSFTLYLTINALFFSEATVNKINDDEGSFNLNYQLPQIVYSSLISSFINAIVKTLCLTEKNIIALKQGQSKDLKKKK